MQSRSATWQALAETGTFILETKAIIGEEEYLPTASPVISKGLFPDGLSVGNCAAACLQITLRTDDVIPKSAEVQMEMRLRNADSSQVTEWLPAGTFYISRRVKDSASGLISLECYDAMLKANQPYIDLEEEGTETGWPKSMVAVVAEIATRLGVSQDSRNSIETGTDYVVPYPGSSTIMDVLGSIGAVHGGNWVITPAGQLRLIPISTAPTEETTGVEEILAVLGALSNGQPLTISGVTMTDDLGASYTAGDDTTYMLNVAGGICATQNLCDDLFDRIEGVVYNSFSVSSGIYDPATELGDLIKYGTRMYGFIAQEIATLGVAFRGNIMAQAVLIESEDEYPYKSKAEKAIEKSQANTAKLEELSGEVDESRKVAVNYLARDSTGIMVADMSGGTAYTPSEVPAGVKNSFIDNDSFDIRDGTDVLASFGETSHVGRDNGISINIGTDGFSVNDASGDAVAKIGVLQDSAVPSIDVVYGHVGETKIHNLRGPIEVGSSIRVQIPGSEGGMYTFTRGTAVTAQIGGHTVDYNGSNQMVFTFVERADAQIEYDALVITSVFGLTIGSRAPREIVGNNSGSIGTGNTATGDNAFVAGEGLTAPTSNSAAVGKYNTADTSYAFEVGTGTDSNDRMTAFAVKWDGDTVIDLDINAAAGTVDGRLYQAICDLGIQSEVIV